MKMPKTPFATRLSGSAKETELRLRSIFQWKKKRPPVVAIVLVVLVVLLCFGLVSCEPEVSDELRNKVEQWVSDYPWSEGSEAVNADTRWEVKSVKRTNRNYDQKDIRGVIYEVECSSESGASRLTLTLLVNPDTLEIYPEPESWYISGKEELPQPSPDEPDVEEPRPTTELKPAVQYTSQQFVFPDSISGMTFAVQLEWPKGWQAGDYDGSGELGEDLFLSRYAIYNGDGSFIGTIGYNTFEPYEGEMTPEVYYQTVYSGIRLGAHYFWEDFSLVAQTDNGQTHRATVYYQKDNGGNAASWPILEADGICSYDKELTVYTALEFQGGAVEDEVLSHIAESIRLELIEGPMAAYERNKRLATIEGISHMPLDELPQEILDSLTLVSETDLSGAYNPEWGWYRTYTAPGLEIVTSAPSAAYLEWREEVDKNNREMFPTEEDFYAYIEGEEGREWLTGVTITNDKFATLDGLKVGMTCEQAKELGYSLKEGKNQVGNTEVELSITVENDTVVQMHTWWTMGRYIGKFFEL